MHPRHQGLFVAQRNRRSVRDVSWIAAVLLVLLGVAGFAAALDGQRSLDDLVERGVPATGLLLVAGGGGERPSVAVQFDTADGTTVVGASNRFDASVMDLEHADAVAIVYDPDKPTVFQGANWAPPQDLPWLGAAWLLLTVGVAARAASWALEADRQMETGDEDDAPSSFDVRPRILART